MSDINKDFQWVPSLYVMEGFPYALVNVVTLVFFKNFNLKNTYISLFTSLLMLPWLCKPLMAPVIETLATKRKWIISVQSLMAVLMIFISLSLSSSQFLWISGFLFLMLGFCSALHDMNADGLYLSHLSSKAQAYFLGIRSLSFQFGTITGQAGLVCLAGFLMNRIERQVAWQSCFLLSSILIGILAYYHKKFLPQTSEPIEVSNNQSKQSFASLKNVLQEFIKIPHLFWVILFMLTYMLPEAQLVKIVPLFLLDHPQHGGLGLSITQVGFICGGIGIGGMLGGILLSGFLLTKIPLNLYLVPITIIASLFNAFYLIMSFTSSPSILLVAIIMAIAQFGYGLTNSAYMMFILKIFNRGQFPMSLYAIGTAIMGACMMTGGAFSGYTQDMLGYHGFFIWILIADFMIILISTRMVRYIPYGI